jgi:hypothetical protein
MLAEPLRSLFKEFIKTRERNLKKVFNAFGTTNFELIIQFLNNAKYVNDLLGIDNSEIEPIVVDLREGLIKTIQENHPEHSEIYYPQLSSIGYELIEFKDIFTTNYDVFLYKTILQIISDYEIERKGVPYQDYFYEEMSPTELSFRNEQVYDEARSIYYLHGALFIYQTPDKTKNYKLRRLEQLRMEYIQLIRREIRNSNFPIFVAEGDSKDKIRSISNNDYLNFCANRLRNSEKNLVVYGFSFGDSDRHIVDLIMRSKIEKVGISIYIGDKSLEELEKESSYFRTVIINKDVAVFDSNTLFPSLRPY